MTRDDYLQSVAAKHPQLADPKEPVSGLAGFWLLLLGQAYDQGKADAANKPSFLLLPNESKNE